MQVAQAVPLPLIGAAAASAAAAVGNAVRETVEDWRKSHSAPPVVQASPSTTNEPAQEKDQDKTAAEASRQDSVAAAAPIPPEDPENKDASQSPATVRPSKEDIQKLVDEHSDKKGLKLTTEAANKIVDETQPSGTKAAIVGKNVSGPDIIYEDTNGARVTSVEVKTAKTLDRAEASVRDALRKDDKPDIVALQIRSDSDIPRLIGKLRNLDRPDTAGRSLVVVDTDGNLLLKLQPFP